MHGISHIVHPVDYKVPLTIISKSSEPISFEDVFEKSSASPEVKVMLKFLLAGSDLELEKLTLKEKLRLGLIVLFPNQKLFAEARELFQEFLDAAFDKVNAAVHGSEQETRLQMIIDDALTDYPFLEPYQEEKPFLRVPQKVNDKWEQVTHTVTPIKLGLKWMAPLYAYLLKPQMPGANGKVIFIGTPPPSITGAALAMWVDWIPGHSVGEILYKMSQETIEKAVAQLHHETGLPVDLHGKSLGGAMSNLTMIHCGGKVNVHAINAPGLATRMYKLYKKNRAEWQAKGQPFPNLEEYTQKKDPVSELIGKFPKESNLFQAIPEQIPNRWFAHFQSFFNMKGEVLKLDPAEFNKQTARKVATIAFHVAACFLIIFTTLGMLIASAIYAATKKQIPAAAAA